VVGWVTVVLLGRGRGCSALVGSDASGRLRRRPGAETLECRPRHRLTPAL